MSGSMLASEIDMHNKYNKADVQLRKCLKCMHFNKTVYKCKVKECVNKENKI